MLVKSTMLKLGTKAPNFKLIDVVSGKTYSLKDFKESKALVVSFICVHCPYVKHIEKEFVKVANDYIDKGVSFVAISSNDVVNYPEDSPENLKKQALRLGFNFPYLFDKTQEVAKSYTAACTPDIFVFDKDKKLVYRGQFDSSRPGKLLVKVTGEDLKKALNKLLKGEKINQDQKPSSGCNIKWRPGNQPEYY